MKMTVTIGSDECAPAGSRRRVTGRPNESPKIDLANPPCTTLKPDWHPSCRERFGTRLVFQHSEEPLLHRLAVADVPLGEWGGDVIGAINPPCAWQPMIISPGADANSVRSGSPGELIEELRANRVLGIFISLRGSKAQIEANKFSHVGVASAHTPDITTEALLVEEEIIRNAAALDRRD